MKVFMILVGTPIENITGLDENHYLIRDSLELGKKRYYFKKEIVNADDQVQSLRNTGINIHYSFLGVRNNPVELIKVGREIRTVIKRHNIELVHVLWGATTSLIAVLFSSVPVVISFCGSDIMGSYDRSRKKTLKGRLSRLLSLTSSLIAKSIITKSGALKDVLWRSAQQKCTIIPNGVDTAKFYPLDKQAARDMLGWQQNKKIVLFLNGSDAHVKNEPFALEVFDIVKMQVGNSALQIINSVIHEDLIYYYNAADALLITSFHEGSNNCIKEALACNLPVVSSNSGDAADRLHGVKNCFVINSFYAEDYAKKLTLILNTSDRSNGVKFIEDLTMPKTAEKIVSVYREALIRN